METRVLHQSSGPPDITTRLQKDKSAEDNPPSKRQPLPPAMTPQNLPIQIHAGVFPLLHFALLLFSVLFYMTTSHVLD